MDIQVILTESDPKLGNRGEVIKVSSGYAQNFLFPHKKAKPATPANLKTALEEKERRAKDQARGLAEARELASKISSASVTIEMLAGEEDKLFGAVTAQDIAAALGAQGISIDRKDVHLEEPIKKLGAYQVPVKLDREAQGMLKLWVVKKK